MNIDKLQQAYGYMVGLIQNGRSFPEAQIEAAFQFHLNDKEAIELMYMTKEEKSHLQL